MELSSVAAERNVDFAETGADFVTNDDTVADLGDAVVGFEIGGAVVVDAGIDDFEMAYVGVAELGVAPAAGCIVDGSFEDGLNLSQIDHQLPLRTCYPHCHLLCRLSDCCYCWN